MKVSIITINKNNKEGLRRTMQSVYEQDFNDFEYIVVDGASTDGSVEVINEYRSLFEAGARIAFQSESKPDKGIFNAMNKGILKSCGEYLLFLNSGDYLVAPTVLSSFVQYGATEDYVCGNIRVCLNGKYELRTNPKKVDFVCLNRGTLLHQASFIKRTAFDRYGMYNEMDRIRGDWEHSLRSIVVGGASYRYVDLTVSHFDITGVSSSGALRDFFAKEKRDAYLSLMPEYVVDALEYYDELENTYLSRLHSYYEYMTIKNGKMGFVIDVILWIKRIKRRVFKTTANSN